MKDKKYNVFINRILAFSDNNSEEYNDINNLEDVER